MRGASKDRRHANQRADAWIDAEAREGLCENTADECTDATADQKKKVTEILKKHMDVGGDLDAEVRSKIKNLEEGTASFEIEYQRVMNDMKRKKGLV